VPHDYAGRGSYPLTRIELVASILAEFLNNAQFDRPYQDKL
jgi:hypothetical protein